VVSSFGELVLTMMDATVLFIAQIHQAILASPAIGVDNDLWGYPSPNDGVHSGLGAIGHHFGVGSASPLHDSKDWSFARGAASLLSLYPPCPAVKFVNLDLSFDGRLVLTQLGDALTDQKKVMVDCVSV